MSTHTLTKLLHQPDLSLPMRLYLYDAQGYHRGGLWIPEEITVAAARTKAELHYLLSKLEVRITDGNDFLVFHAKDGEVLFPPDPNEFWRRAQALR